MITIRPATLADAAAISAVHCSTVDAWRDPYTRQTVDEATLDLFGHWYNGGDWMSVETCAIHLNGLLMDGHLPLVAETDGDDASTAGSIIVGEAEYYINREPAPFGPHLHLSVLYIHRDWQGQGIGRALITAGVEHARALGCHALTTQPEPEMTGFYRRVGFELWQRAKEMQTVTQTVAQQATQSAINRNSLNLIQLSSNDRSSEHLALRIGRYQCGVQGWETLWPSLALAELTALRRGAWRGELDGVPVILGLREQFRNPMQADGYAWLPPSALLTPAVDALRDLVAREGYSAVDLLLPEDALPELRTMFKLDYQTTVELWIKQT
ncbi:MAG: GNAT family N-acetyltransferase [Anaerolineae bacterium]|nr:GNAT family N-acetyltransferase [Anaerolineae bacterium]